MNHFLQEYTGLIAGIVAAVAVFGAMFFIIVAMKPALLTFVTNFAG